jgi:hypothetical protein
MNACRLRPLLDGAVESQVTLHGNLLLTATETGWFMPPERPNAPDTSGPHASPIDWTEDVAVDTRGNIYISDDKWGIFILRYLGAGQPAPTAH